MITFSAFLLSRIFVKINSIKLELEVYKYNFKTYLFGLINFDLIIIYMIYKQAIKNFETLKYVI
jgi:hypothetical protein